MTTRTEGVSRLAYNEQHRDFLTLEVRHERKRLKKTGAAVRKKKERKKHDKHTRRANQLFFIQLKEKYVYKKVLERFGVVLC